MRLISLDEPLDRIKSFLVLLSALTHLFIPQAITPPPPQTYFSQFSQTGFQFPELFFPWRIRPVALKTFYSVITQTVRFSPLKAPLHHEYYLLSASIQCIHIKSCHFGAHLSFLLEKTFTIMCKSLEPAQFLCIFHPGSCSFC